MLQLLGEMVSNGDCVKLLEDVAIFKTDRGIAEILFDKSNKKNNEEDGDLQKII